jgi:regulator of PEP synthase PpsR (kinase-PPPase family)
VAGNRMYRRRVEERITLEVKAMVEQKKNEQEFLEAMIKELEEKYRIELRKKAILKNQCDQAYLRGVSAISNEALKMSHSTLNDFYKGMKMPKYDGQNVYNQLQQL